MSEVPVSPTRRRRRWWVGLLVLLIAVGGGVWWRNRLTPEERTLVGRWQCSHRMTSGSIVETVEDIRNDRTLITSGKPYRWTVKNGRIAIQESLPQQAVFAKWIQSGFKNWPIHKTDKGRVEIIVHDTVIMIIMMRNFGTGECEDKLDLRRIVEK